ncbi:MAG: hypothetical protein DLM71_02955 [Chloroflexi bacterium]|nr:MAG: hypothetical protein DLM71_02955 [Chloroflexota bacterium]
MIRCLRCGEENPERARFCLSCASPLVGGVPAAREVRKTVTVLFSDAAGSTALGERALGAARNEARGSVGKGGPRRRGKAAHQARDGARYPHGRSTDQTSR